jgi:CubicO group peptidase (beta-lactamase class C family)
MNRKSALEKIKDKKFKKLCEIAVSEMKRLDIPGVSIGVWNAEEEFSAGFGITSLENPLPVNAETLFQVGSISKTFTGTLLMRLAETGKLDLDTPVRTYLPHLQLADSEVTEKVTTRHLLTHTGGWVGDYFNDFGNGNNALAKMVKSLARLPQITPLGEVWSYNNTGFNIAGRLVEVLTKSPYEKAVQKILLDPLGLGRSFFYPDDLLLTHRFAVGHSKWEGKVKVARPWAVGRATNPVGGVVSTVKDLLTYARFHMGNGKSASGEQVISRESLETMRVPQAEAGGRGKIGITWFIRSSQADEMTIFGHGGATHGQQAVLQFIPEKNFAIAALTNSDDGGMITDNLLQWALEIYFDTALPIPPPSQKPDADLKEYAGTYDLPLSAFTLEVKDGYLVQNEIPRGGFPTPETPPGPAAPPVRLAFYDQDRVIGLDEPGKGALGDFLRDKKGKLAFFRSGGRVHPKI